MSYNFAILAHPIPDSDQEAWELMDELTERDVDEALPIFHKLVDKLTERHPCICDLSDDEVNELGVWSDGPLRNNIFQESPVLGLASHRAGEILPFVIETANALGLALLDFQTETIHRPRG